MNVLDAAYATVHDFAGGSEALAPRMGMSAAVLRAKVNPNTDRNHLTLAEADRMLGLTGDFRVLQALAAAHGFALQALRDVDADASIAGLVLDANTAAGHVATSIRHALTDGLITENEMRTIGAAGLREQQVIVRLLAHLRTLTGRRLPGDGL